MNLALTLSVSTLIVLLLVLIKKRVGWDKSNVTRDMVETYRKGSYNFEYQYFPDEQIHFVLFYYSVLRITSQQQSKWGLQWVNAPCLRCFSPVVVHFLSWAAPAASLVWYKSCKTKIQFEEPCYCCCITSCLCYSKKWDPNWYIVIITWMRSTTSNIVFKRIHGWLSVLLLKIQYYTYYTVRTTT